MKFLNFKKSNNQSAESNAVATTELKFLIIRFSSIGDIVLTTPVIRCLRKKYPTATIHYLTKKNF
jgi:hypothetical protein